MKCFERLVMQHISLSPPLPGPIQFAYRSNRSTDDAIATALHPALTHLDKKGMYVRLLFIDFSSALTQSSLNSSFIIGPAGAQHVAVQLAVGLSDRETSGSTGRQ